MLPKWLTALALGTAAGAALGVADKLLTKDEPRYNTKDASDILKISEYTVRKKIRDGEIKAETIPGKAGYRITQSALDDYQNRKNRFTINPIQSNNPPTYDVGNFSNLINTFTNESIDSDNENIDIDLIDTLIEGKNLDLDAYRLELQRLTLLKSDSDDFMKEKLSLQIAMKNLQAEIKAYEFIKKSLEDNATLSISCTQENY